MSLSSIVLSGTVSRDAEQRVTPNNNTVTSFMMQMTTFDNRSKEEKAYPVKVSLWGDAFAELSSRIKQNARVIVSGRPQIEQFTDKNGKNVRLFCIEGSRLNFIEDLLSSNDLQQDSLSQMPESTSISASELEEQEIPF
jgi:single-stranded DNA-binding protein